MARKSREQWSEAYKRRIERAEAKAIREGRAFTKASARGHKAKEHITRRQNKQFRLLNENALTSNQQSQVTKFFQTLPGLYQTQTNRDKLVQAIQTKGWDWFRGVQATRRKVLKASEKGPIGSKAFWPMYVEAGIDMSDDMDWLLYYLGF